MTINANLEDAVASLEEDRTNQRISLFRDPASVYFQFHEHSMPSRVKNNARVVEI
ncbi:hypothetical protein X777_02058 [Ooceraea biroi]|uniref:Uncharacterized protein n=1 Tax=Ooceraea biroi TaxID=2015173 RepID=A0A026WR01_OOCBI|nr:hypothetical protein X777_02058 [Ooceraea biroi]